MSAGDLEYRGRVCHLLWNMLQVYGVTLKGVRNRWGYCVRSCTNHKYHQGAVSSRKQAQVGNNEGMEVLILHFFNTMNHASTSSVIAECHCYTLAAPKDHTLTSGRRICTFQTVDVLTDSRSSVSQSTLRISNNAARRIRVSPFCCPSQSQHQTSLPDKEDQFLS